MHRIGIQTSNIVKDNDPLEGFGRIAEAGFDCCDFSLDSYLRYEEFAPDYGPRFFDKSIDELQEFFNPHKMAAKAYGIKINQMHMPYPLYASNVSDEANDYLRYQMMQKSMELCKFFECPNIVIHQFNLPPSPDASCNMEEEGREWNANAKYINAIAPFAAAHGITVCLENLYRRSTPYMVEGPCCDPVKLAARIDYFNNKYSAPVLGACFDTGHANLVNMDMESYLRILGHRVKVLHIHDNDRISDLHQIPYTFTNTRDKICSITWDKFLETLDAIGFEGVLSFETAPVLNAFPEALGDDALILIASIGRYFAKELNGLKINNKLAR